jgi:hypothetical protein
MADRWELIDEMVCELGELYSLEVEASAYPEITEDPAFRAVHMAVLRATNEVTSLTGEVKDTDCMARAREALDAARASAASARVLLFRARAARNREA